MINKEFRYLGFLDIPYYACSDGHLYDREYHIVNEFGRSGTDSRYKAVSLCGKNYAVHHLIGWAFPEIVGEYEFGLEIDHLNTDPSDNRPENLKWRTHAENMHNPITWERMHSKEYRQKQSKSQKKRWEDDEQRQRQSELQKARWADPERRQEQSERSKTMWEDSERRQEQSERLKAIWTDPELKQKASKSQKKRWEDTELKQKQSESHKKPIVQLTLKGEFIREWDSATDAYDELGIHGGNISSCCKGKVKSAGKFKWMYYDEYCKNPIQKKESN